jgi:hypothetical protein
MSVGFARLIRKMSASSLLISNSWLSNIALRKPVSMNISSTANAMPATDNAVCLGLCVRFNHASGTPRVMAAPKRDRPDWRP